jgi:hypothetical protein
MYVSTVREPQSPFIEPQSPFSEPQSPFSEPLSPFNSYVCVDTGGKVLLV